MTKYTYRTDDYMGEVKAPNKSEAVRQVSELLKPLPSLQAQYQTFSVHSQDECPLFHAGKIEGICTVDFYQGDDLESSQSCVGVFAHPVEPTPPACQRQSGHTWVYGKFEGIERDPESTVKNVDTLAFCPFCGCEMVSKSDYAQIPGVEGEFLRSVNEFLPNQYVLTTEQKMGVFGEPDVILKDAADLPLYIPSDRYTVDSAIALALESTKRPPAALPDDETCIFCTGMREGDIDPAARFIIGESDLEFLKLVAHDQSQIRGADWYGICRVCRDEMWLGGQIIGLHNVESFMRAARRDDEAVGDTETAETATVTSMT